VSAPAANTPFNVWTVGDLTIESVINGGNGIANANVGFVKAGGGTLTLHTPVSAIPGLVNAGTNSMSGQLVINQGTLKLDGGTNTIQANNFLEIGVGGTLDLNGRSQYVLGLFTDGAVAGGGGTVMSSNGQGTLVNNADNAARNFAGSIVGSVFYNRAGQSTLTFFSPQTFTGGLLINGGTTVLRDAAAFTDTQQIDVNFATLTADNNVGTMDASALPAGGRLKDDASLWLRGATLNVTGRAQTASTEKIGALVLDGGYNVITPAVGGTGVNSIELTSTLLIRAGNLSSTLQVGGTNLGTIGSNSRLLLATAPTLINNIVADPSNKTGWGEAGNDFLTYIPGLGLAALNQTGAAGYDFTNLIPAGDNSTKNVRLTATTAVPAGGAVVNALSMSGSNIALTFAAGADTLNLTSGGLIGPNNNQSIGATLDSGRLTVGGLAPVGSQDLYLFNRANTLTVNSRIIDNPNGITAPVRAVLTASGGTIALANGLNSYTGGLVVNGGTVTLTATSGITVPAATVPTDGLMINGATVTMTNTPQQIAPTNIVTLIGPSALNLFGSNTLAGLVFNNIGGGATTPTVTTFNPTATAGAAANGVLTIGAAGITVTSSNVSSTPMISGRLDFGATPGVINVEPIKVNDVAVAPLQAALAIQGIVNSAGGIDKQGDGVLQLNAQQSYTGPTMVNGGGLRLGVTNAGSRYSALVLNSGTRLDLNGIATTVGSLSGLGTVFNSGAAQTLTVGFDNTSTTFSGQLSRFNDAVVNAVAINKVGSGTMTMDSAQVASTGTTGLITVNGGRILYTGAGKALPSVAAAAGSFTVNSGGTLTLDNSLVSVDHRLGLNAAGTLNLQGGALNIGGNSLTPTLETINLLNITNGGGVVTFNPDPAQPMSIAVTTLSGGNSTGSLVIRGLSTTSGNGTATLTINTPAVQAGQGTGTGGSTNMPIRHDILGDLSPTGNGTGFLVRDDSGFWRPMVAAERNTVPSTWVAGQNAGVTSAQTIATNTVVNSLTMGGSGSLGSGLGATFGSFGPAGGLLTQTLANASAVLALDGNNAITVGSLTNGGGITPYIHVLSGATLDLNAALGIGGTAGFVKMDGGVLNLNRPAYYTGGNTTVNGGTLNLNSGQDNTLAVVPTAAASTVTPLNLNGLNAVVDLKGNNQAVGVLTTVSPLPGNGGTVTNSGSTMATLTATGTSTFAGQLTGTNLAFTRMGNTTTTLTNANTYGGPTTVRGGTLQLRDSGSILNTSSITANFGTVLVDNFGLNPVGDPNPTRIAAGTPVTLEGGTLTLNGAGSTDSTLVVSSLTAAGAQNTVNVLPFVNEGSTAKITIGNLLRDPATHSVVNFNGFTNTNNTTGTSTTGGQGFNANGQIILEQVNGAAPVSFNFVGASTSAGSNVVTVSSTMGLQVGLPVVGTGLPAGEFVTAITGPTTFTVTTGTGVTTQASTTLVSNNLTNNLIGGWAVADGSTFATYLTTAGVSVMGQTTQGVVAPAFDGTDVSAATNATQNISDATTTRTITTSASANSWRLVPTAAQTITLGALGAPVTRNIGVGLITNAGFSSTIRSFDPGSALTGSGSDLYTYINQNTVSLNTKITGALNLIKGGGGTLVLSPSTSYTAAQTVVGDVVPITNTIGLSVGQSVLGTGIPAGTTIVAVTPNVSVQLSAPTTALVTLFQAGGVNNDYTGATYVNAGTLNLNAPAGAVTIPGDLLINNATVTMNANAGQIATVSDVTIEGGGTLTFAGSNTVNSVRFKNIGGTANPSVATSTGLTLNAANAVTATNESLATTPTISGINLTLANTAPVITTTAGFALTSLAITAPISTANVLTKAGPGALALNPNFALANSSTTAGTAQISVTSTAGLSVGMAATGTGLPAGESILSIDDATHVTLTTGTGVTAQPTTTVTFAGSTFSAGFNHTEGSLIFAQSTNQNGATVLAGPVGTGTLTLGDNTTVLSDGTVRTIGNAVNVTGNIAFGGVTAGNSVILSGAMNLGAAGRSLEVTSPAVTATLSGAVTSTALGTALTKTGLGTLILANAGNDFGGAGISVAAGMLRNGVNNAIPNASPLAISAGAGYDLNNFDQAIQRISGAGFITNSANAAKTLVVGGTSAADTTTNASSTFDGVITDNRQLQTSSALALTKAGSGKLTLTNANSYRGATTINGGTLELAGLNGGISGSTAITASTGGSLLLSSTAADRINNTASLSLAGGSLAFADSLTGANETIGALNVSASSTIDFGKGIGNGNTFTFSSLTLDTGVDLKIFNWTGMAYTSGGDSGANLDQDRLLFSGTTAGNPVTSITFYSDDGVTPIGYGREVPFAGGFEIVPVPEPSSIALLGTAALLGLAGVRRRRG
jgi:autotransporter-associated beta strand protein